MTSGSSIERPSVLVVCCADIPDPNWRWLEEPFAGTSVRFEFARAYPRNKVERAVRILNLARLRGSFQAVWRARRKHAQVIVTHGPALAAWCALFARILRLRIPIIGHTFNFAELPGSAKRRAFSWMLARIDRFVVFSTMERALYARVFHLPEARFDVIRWGVRPPSVDSPNTAMHRGEYICAIGGNARDYRTLVEAARLLPNIHFVCVMRPHNLKNLDLPANVEVFTDLPFGKAMNVLKHSRLMVLPLLHSEVPCGHVTLVAAMYLGKPIVVTNSEGIRDYVSHGYNALTVGAGSAAALAEASERLWKDAALRLRLGENGRTFAQRECTEERIIENFQDILLDAGFVLNAY